MGEPGPVVGAQRTAGQVLSSVRSGEHLCCVFVDDRQRRAGFLQFSRDGLEQGQQILYIAARPDQEQILVDLHSTGLDGSALLAAGQLALTPVEELTGPGLFDADRVFAWLSKRIGVALSAGYPALRLIIEMSWAADPECLLSSPQLLAYEARINELVAGGRLCVICQYDRRLFDPSTMLDVLLVHARVARGPDVAQIIANEASLRASEARLRSRENQLRGLIERSPVGIALTDETGTMIEWNPRAAEIYQLPVAQVIGRPIWEVRAEIDPSDRQGSEAFRQETSSLHEFFRTGSASWLYQAEDRQLTCPTGERRIIQRTRFPLQTEQGFMLASILNDVTEQRAAERELEHYRQRLEAMVEQRTAELQHEIQERQKVEDVLRESEGRYRALVNQSPLSILVAQDDRYIYANQSFVDRLGYSSTYELVGRAVMDLVAPESRELVQARGTGALSGVRCEPAVIAYLRKDGGVYYSENTNVPIFYQGRPAMLVIGQDVSDRVRYEQRLKDSLAEKEVMLREIHHRVKNNLSVIISLIDLQKGAQTDLHVLAVFKELQTRAYTMALVHENLYRSPDLARVNFGQYLHTLVSHLYSVYGPSAQPGGQVRPVHFSVDVDNVELKIETAIPCGLIVNELVTNALKYAFPPALPESPNADKCEISIHLERARGAKLALTICDNGVSLPSGLDWRAAATMGLQLVQVLARQLGGQIELLPLPGAAWKLTFSDEP